MGEFRVRIFDRHGTPLVEPRVFAPRSWVLNRYGQCKIPLPKTDAAATPQNINQGNLVLVESADVESWGGVIDLPEEWDEDNINLSVYSAEYLFKFRDAPKNLILDGTPGSNFARWVAEANAIGDLRIKPGDIWSGGSAYPITLHLDNLYDVITKMSDTVGQDWGLTPAIDPYGKLYFEANWYQKRGVNRSPFVLREGTELKPASGKAFSKQGAIANSITGYGDGSTWEAKPVTFPAIIDQTSIDTYGIRQSAASIHQLTMAAVVTGVNGLLANSKQPRKVYNVEAIDKRGDGTSNGAFGNLLLGDTNGLELYRYDFAADGQLGTKTTVRVMAKSYDERDGEMPLTLDEAV